MSEQQGCTGASDCITPIHQHGCYADTSGPCNERTEHPAPVPTEHRRRIDAQVARQEQYLLLAIDEQDKERQDWLKRQAFIARHNLRLILDEITERENPK